MATIATTNKPLPQIKRAWWKEASVYQIYPASFCHSGRNSTGWKSPDGLAYGDLKGIISKLDYIAHLGVDILWLSPILASPQVDMGYDISDYRQVDARYGSTADHEELIREVKKRGMKYVMDLVVNHTSNEHAWFQESRLSRTSSKRNWYVWRKARYDVPGYEGKRMPPNNWESAFSGSVWEWDDATQEYYLHLFAKEQPDLNWENPEVREAVYEMMRFWLQRGVDGFRMDVINFISKAYDADGNLPDGKVTRDGFLQSGVEWYACGPRLHEYFKDIGGILREFDAFSVGEMPGVKDEKEILKGVGQDRGELAMAFQFDVVSMDIQPGKGKWWPRKFEPRVLREVVNKWQRCMIDGGGWNSLFMENHDQGRTVSRYASDEPALRSISAKMIGAHLALQCGTVFVYQGQELGMADVPKDWGMDKYKDIECLNHWETVLRDYPHDEKMQKMFRDQYRLIGRDNARTPMQWDGTKGAGFVPSGSDLVPWMDVHPDHDTWNAEKVVADENSSYHYWRKLLEFRKQEKDVIVYGEFEMLDMDNEFPEVVAYVRTSERKKVIVITSFDKEEVKFTIPKEHAGLLPHGVVPSLRNYAGDIRMADNTVSLRPFEVLVAIA